MPPVSDWSSPNGLPIANQWKKRAELVDALGKNIGCGLLDEVDRLCLGGRTRLTNAPRSLRALDQMNVKRRDCPGLVLL